MNVYRRSIARLTQIAGGVALAALIGGMPVAQAATETNTASLSVAVAAQADVAAHDDGVDTYTLTVTNRGGGVIEAVSLSVPIEAGYRLAATSFDQERMWVSNMVDGQATIRIEGMRGVGDAVSGTLRFVGPDSSAASALAERVTAHWTANEEDFSAQSNLPAAGVQQLAVAAAAGGYRLSSDIFAVNEPVSFWYTSPAGVSTELVVVDGELTLQPAKSDIEDIPFSTYYLADATGALAVPMSVAGIPAGTYTLVARGNWSGATAAAMISIP